MLSKSKFTVEHPRRLIAETQERSWEKENYTWMGDALELITNACAQIKKRVYTQEGQGEYWRWKKGGGDREVTDRRIQDHIRHNKPLKRWLWI